MLEYDENCLEEYKEYTPYNLGYDEVQSLEEIEYAIHKGSVDSMTMSDFKDYLKYLKKKISGIINLELSEGNKVGELSSCLSRVQNLLSDMAKRPVL